METLQTKEFYDFVGFRLDVENRLLRCGNETVDLNLKEFEVLFFLVENAGRVVTKDILLDAVWKDLFIEEGTLTQNISRLRKKLAAASQNGDSVIETLPKRGYRFLPAVTAIDRGNTLVVEEQTIQHFRIEETLTVSGVEMQNEVGSNNTILALPGARRRVPSSLLVGLGSLAIVIIGLIGYLTYFRRSESKPIAITSITPFSGAIGRENMPAFSPDGKQVAFSWSGDDGDDLDIYVRLVGAVEPLRLTNTNFDEHYPVFSPDGSHIAFVRDLKTHGEVILISALGGAERRIASLFSGFASISLSSDGNTLAVVDTADSTSGKPYAIYLVDIQTGDRRRLTSPADFLGETTPRFSPDGKNVAFIRATGDKDSDLFIVPATGGEPRQLTFDRSVIHSLAWAPDGQHIFFASYRGGAQARIWRTSADGGEPEPVPISGKDITNIAVSPDGKTVAFVDNARNTDIWSVASDGSPPRRFAASVYNENDPNVSSDGTRVVFTSNRTGRSAIWISASDGKNLRPLVDTPSGVGAPRFSPDGSQVAYQSITDDGNSDLFVVSTEGRSPRRITTDAARDVLPVWSSDGSSIYFTSNRNGEKQIWRISVSRGEDSAVQITQGGAVQPISAPDGKTIFYIKESEITELWHVPSAGGLEEKLPELAVGAFNGGWKVTLNGIYFLTRDADQGLKIRFFTFADKTIRDTAGTVLIPKNILGSIDTADGKLFFYSLLDLNASSIMLAKTVE